MSAKRVFRILVPGSTSNLGPGFDLLGLALRLPLRVELKGIGRSRLLRRGAQATLRVPLEEDLLLRSARALASSAGRALPPLDLLVHSRIPVARGLGSSGAAVAAGLLLADSLLGLRLPRRELASIGADVEGHPENVAASLLGGLVGGLPREGGGWIFFRPRIHPRIFPAVAWPSTEVATERARAALPETVRFEVARDNARNLAALLEGLRTADPGLLGQGVREGLHVPFRAPAIPGCEEALAAARRAGALAATISGSGSALLALCGSRARARAAAGAMVAAFRRAGSRASGGAIPIAPRGATVARSGRR